MNSPFGTFYGGWYFAVERAGSIFGLLTGPFATRGEAEATAVQAKGFAVKNHIADTPETTWGCVVAFRSTLCPGQLNDKLWGLPQLQKEPVDIMRLEPPALYMVTKPDPLPLKNGGW